MWHRFPTGGYGITGWKPLPHEQLRSGEAEDTLRPPPKTRCAGRYGLGLFMDSPFHARVAGQLPMTSCRNASKSNGLNTPLRSVSM